MAVIVSPSFIIILFLLLSTLSSVVVVECHFSNNINQNGQHGHLFGSKLWSSIKKLKSNGSVERTNSNKDFDLESEFRNKLGYTGHTPPNRSPLYYEFQKKIAAGDATRTRSAKKVIQASLRKQKNRNNIESDIRGGTAAAGHIVKTMTARRMETLKYVKISFLFGFVI
jgi:hypothetical protein